MERYTIPRMSVCSPSLEVKSEFHDEITVVRKRCIYHGLDCPALDSAKHVLLIQKTDTGVTFVEDDICHGKHFTIDRSSPGWSRSTFQATLFKCQPLSTGTGYRVVSTASASTPSVKVDYSSADLEAMFGRMSLTAQPQSKHLSLAIERSTYHQVSVTWKRKMGAELPDKWLVSLSRMKSSTPATFFFVDARLNHLDFPVELTPGIDYQIRIRAIKRSGENCTYPIYYEKAENFTADLTMQDLQALYSMALNFSNRNSFTPCNWLYRNRWKEYFEEIFNKHQGIMKVYKKDKSGDQASPINERINGLFFMAKNVNGRPPPDSPFGRIRLQVPANVLLEKAPNLYFTDFYCMRGRIHYVTLVMTKPGSEADVFCRSRLMPLDINDKASNPFLFRMNGQLYVNSTFYLQVELFYTEDVNILDLVRNRGAMLLNNIPTIGKGRSTPGGIPKNPCCSECNLPRSTGFLTKI